jgi:hypothetical protein
MVDTATKLDNPALAKIAKFGQNNIFKAITI